MFGKLYTILKSGRDHLFKQRITSSPEFCCAVKKIIEQYLIINGAIPKVTNCAALPPANLHNGEIYAVLNSTGSKWRPTWLGGGTFCPKGFWISDGLVWNYLGEFPNQADQATVDAGTDDTQFITPKTLTNSAQLLAKQVNIQLKDEGVNLGASGTVDVLDFVGGGVTATRIGNTVTVSVPATVPGGYSTAGLTVVDSIYTIALTSGYTIFLIDCSGGDVFINLPTAVGNTSEFEFKKIDSSSNKVRITPDGVETIDGYSYIEILFQNTNFSIISNNSNWYR